jgi:hypothetical protein
VSSLDGPLFRRSVACHSPRVAASEERARRAETLRVRCYIRQRSLQSEM